MNNIRVGMRSNYSIIQFDIHNEAPVQGDLVEEKTKTLMKPKGSALLKYR